MESGISMFCFFIFRSNARLTLTTKHKTERTHQIDFHCLYSIIFFFVYSNWLSRPSLYQVINMNGPPLSILLKCYVMEKKIGISWKYLFIWSIWPLLLTLLMFFRNYQYSVVIVIQILFLIRWFIGVSVPVFLRHIKTVSVYSSAYPSFGLCSTSLV